MYIGKSDELAYGLFSVHPDHLFWIGYTPIEGKHVSEKCTVVPGELKRAAPWEQKTNTEKKMPFQRIVGRACFLLLFLDSTVF